MATAGVVAGGRIGISGAEAGGRDHIKVGQIGTKHAHASGKIAAMRKLDEIYEVVGVVEPDTRQWERVRTQSAYKGLKRMSEEQLLNTPGLKAVAVETEVAELAQTGIRCLKAGMHIHLDKPAGPSMSECRKLHAEAGRQGLTIQMGYMLRYNPGFQFMFKAVREGWLGNIVELSAMMGKRGNDGLRRELALYAGGGMFELACHLVDAVVTVLGKPDRILPISHQTYPEKDAAADNQLAVFDYPQCIATIRCNHLDPFGFPRRQFNVTGEAGTIEIQPMEPPKLQLALSKPKGGYKKGYQEVNFEKPSGRYDGEFLDLAKVIRGEKQLAWDSEHDLIVHEAVLRAGGMEVD